MTPAALLTGEIVALDRALDRASGSLKTLGDAAGTSLLKRVRGMFENAILSNRSKCQDLRKRIEGGGSAEAGWSELASIQSEASDLLHECLAFIEGALVRQGGVGGDAGGVVRRGFDGGICALADSMLGAISEAADLGWQRFTLLAAGEFYSTLSGIVRLRFTDTDIWNLPIGVHEFGHYAASTQQFDDFKALAGAQDPPYDSHLRELFADIFATYAAGPSLMMACALLRYNPSTGESATHPSNAQRVWCMLQTLAKMDEKEDEPLFASTAAKVVKDWSAALKAAGQPETLADAELKRLQPWFAQLYDFIQSRVPALRYRSMLNAKMILADLRDGNAPAPRETDSIPDVLNAAWLYRLNMNGFNVFELDGIASKALQMCESIANRG